MGNLGETLAKKIKQLGVARQVEAVGVVEAATTEIAKFIPKDDFEVISFKDGVLKISTDSTVIKNEISLQLGDRIKAELAIQRVIFISRTDSNLEGNKGADTHSY